MNKLNLKLCGCDPQYCPCGDIHLQTELDNAVEKILTPNEYQNRAFATALPQCQNANYMVLGLCNEAGEAAGKQKKLLRGDAPHGEIIPQLAKELGDTLWYLSGAAKMIGYTLEEIMQMNLEKVADRVARGVQQGSGDNR